MRAKYLAALLMTGPLLLPRAASANESIYTDVKIEGCKTLAEDDMGISAQCKGPKGYPMYFKEGDLRQTVFFGFIRKSYVEEGFESFEPFNSAGQKAEWRLDAKGKPVSAILRYIAEYGEGTDQSQYKKGEVLAISRVAQKADGLGCVTAYVDARANADANTLARKIADEIAPGFACGTDQPKYHGKRGPSAPEPMLSLPAN